MNNKIKLNFILYIIVLCIGLICFENKVYAEEITCTYQLDLYIPPTERLTEFGRDNYRAVEAEFGYALTNPDNLVLRFSTGSEEEVSSGTITFDYHPNKGRSRSVGDIKNFYGYNGNSGNEFIDSSSVDGAYGTFFSKGKCPTSIGIFGKSDNVDKANIVAYTSTDEAKNAIDKIDSKSEYKIRSTYFLTNDENSQGFDVEQPSSDSEVEPLCKYQIANGVVYSLAFYEDGYISQDLTCETISGGCSKYNLNLIEKPTFTETDFPFIEGSTHERQCPKISYEHEIDGNDFNVMIGKEGEFKNSGVSGVREGLGEDDLDYDGAPDPNADNRIDLGAEFKCEDLRDTETYKWIKDIFFLIQIIVPIMLLVLGSIDFIKAVAAQKDDDMKKTQSTFIKRLIIAVAIFLMPAILNLIFSFLTDTFNITTCGIGGGDTQVETNN